MKALAQLKADLHALQSEYDNINVRCSQDDIESVSDRYQEALEASWYKRDLSDQMKDLEEQIVNMELNEANNHVRLMEFDNTNRQKRWDNYNQERYYTLPDAKDKRAAQIISNKV